MDREQESERPPQGGRRKGVSPMWNDPWFYASVFGFMSSFALLFYLWRQFSLAGAEEAAVAYEVFEPSPAPSVSEQREFASVEEPVPMSSSEPLSPAASYLKGVNEQLQRLNQEMAELKEQLAFVSRQLEIIAQKDKS